MTHTKCKSHRQRLSIYLDTSKSIWEEVGLHGTPSVLFSVNKYVNMFYHLCVLFSEYFPDEISLGILNNPVYRRKHEDLKTQKLHALFQRLQEHAFYTWDFMGLPLSETSDMASTKRILVDTSQKVAGTWFEIYQEAINDYEVIWTQTEPKLKRFASDFEAQWISIYESVSTVMSKMTKLSWKTRRVNVHLVDCIYGGSAWTRDIALPPFPDVDVEKKLLAHELVHTLVPDYYLKARLEEAGLDWNLAHTVVDPHRILQCKRTCCPTR